jgi:hypothetical protein
MSWRVGSWLAVAGGIVLLLYAATLILFGTEDVGGFHVSVPWGSALAGFAIWNFVREYREEFRAT